MLTRRHLLATTALVPLVVAACAGQTTSTTLTQLSTDVGLVASGLSAAIAANPIVGLSVTAQNDLAADLATVIADAKTVQATIAADTAPDVTIVEQIATSVQALATLVTPYLPATSNLMPIIQAALSLLPAILAAAGVSSARPVKAVYSPDIARMILAGAGN